MRRPTSAQALSQRARLILACAEGKTNTVVAQEFSVTRQMVGKWRARFCERRLGDNSGPALGPEVEIWLDVGRLASALADARRLTAAGSAPEALARYQEAIDLYQGEFLVEELDVEWACIEREHLREEGIRWLRSRSA